MASDIAATLPHMVYATIVEARKLKGVDWNGKSDPFVTIVTTKGDLHEQLAKGEHVSNDLNPTWMENFVMVVAGRNEYFDIEVWDHNTVASDKCIGRARVPLERWEADQWNDLWIQLDTKGEVRIRGLIRPVRTDDNVGVAKVCESTSLAPTDAAKGEMILLEPPFLACTRFPRKMVFLECTDYFGGATVRGCLVLALRSKKEYQNIRITLVGEILYHWITVTHDKNGNTQTHHHYLKMFPQKVAGFVAKEKKEGDLPHTSKFKPGVHVIPFSIDLPRDLPANDSASNSLHYSVDVRLAKSMATDTKISAPFNCRGPVPPSGVEPVAFSYEDMPGVQVTISGLPFIVKGERCEFTLTIQNSSDIPVTGLKTFGCGRSFHTTTPTSLTEKYHFALQDFRYPTFTQFYVNGAKNLESLPSIPPGTTWAGTVAFDIDDSWRTSVERRTAGMSEVKAWIGFSFESNVVDMPPRVSPSIARLNVFVHNNPKRYPTPSSTQHNNPQVQADSQINGIILPDPTLAQVPPPSQTVTIQSSNSAHCQIPPSNANLTELYYSEAHRFDVQPTTRDLKSDQISPKYWTRGQVPTMRLSPKEQVPANLDEPAGTWTKIPNPAWVP